MQKSTEPASDYIQNVGKIFAIYVVGMLAIVTFLSIVERLGGSALTLTGGIALLAASIFLGVGLCARTGQAKQYFLAGCEIPPFYNGLAIAAAWLPLTAFLGLSGVLFDLGFDGLSFLVGMLGGLVVLSVLIAPYVTRSRAVTLPEFFGVRYGWPVQFLAALLVLIVAFALAVSSIAAMGSLAEAVFGLSYEHSVWGAVAFLFVMTAAGGMRSVTWTQAAQYVFMIAALLAPVTLLSMQNFGNPFAALTAGQALEGIAALEMELIEKGLADAGSLKPHLAPFLQIDVLNFMAIAFVLMTGTACLPHLVMRPAVTSNATSARLSVAWSAFFALLFALTLPAYAAFTKLEVYRVISKSVAFADIPPWFADASRAGLLSIHGVSVDALAEAVEARSSGATDAAAIEAHIKALRLHRPSAFLAQGSAVKAALAETAAGLTNASPSATWEAFCKKILPVAATQAGNERGLLTQSAIAFQPLGVAVLAVSFLKSSPIAVGIVLAGTLAAFLAATSGFLFSMASTLGHDVYYRFIDRNATGGRRIGATLAALGLVSAAAGYGALRGFDPNSGPIADLAGMGFSLAAAAFFPALMLGVWWKRANAWGAAAGMLAGVGLCLTYYVGQRYFPLAFYETWTALFATDPDMAQTFDLLKSNWQQAAGADQLAARQELEAFVGGSAYQAGAASWWGVLSPYGAVFAVPFGFLIAIVVSLVTPRPTVETEVFVEGIRRP